MLGAVYVESVNRLHCGEEQDVPDGGGIGQEHDDPVDAETDAAGGGIPYSSAAMKFSSMGIASSSPFAFPAPAVRNAHAGRWGRSAR